MRFLYLLLTSISFSLFCFGQQADVKAVYFNSKGNPNKIEEKYIKDDTITYIAHDNSTTKVLKRITSYKNDTTIITETYYDAFWKKSKLELLQSSNQFITSTYTNNDTINIAGYFSLFYDTAIFMADTILTGKAAKESYNFMDNIKYARVPNILANNISIKIDSLKPEEIVVSYFIDGFLVKREIKDSKNIINNTAYGNYNAHGLILQSYFSRDSIKKYQVDTLKWNKSKSKIIWSSNRMDELKWNYVSNYQIKGNHLTFIFCDTIKNRFVFMNKKNILRNILISNFIYTDMYYNFEMRYFDRVKLLKTIAAEEIEENKFIHDKQKRIIEQNTYSNKKLIRHVVYSYKN